jgi:hypothetical protein
LHVCREREPCCRFSCDDHGDIYSTIVVHSFGLSEARRRRKRFGVLHFHTSWKAATTPGSGCLQTGDNLFFCSSTSNWIWRLLLLSSSESPHVWRFASECHVVVGHRQIWKWKATAFPHSHMSIIAALLLWGEEQLLQYHGDDDLQDPQLHRRFSFFFAAVLLCALSGCRKKK